MKKSIHPEYHQATVTCSCGNTFKVGSVLTEIHTELCSLCHPFYTGTQKLVDTAGRVEKFRTRVKKASDTKDAERKVKEKREMKVIDMPVGELQTVASDQSAVAPEADMKPATKKKKTKR